MIARLTPYCVLLGLVAVLLAACSSAPAPAADHSGPSGTAAAGDTGTANGVVNAAVREAVGE